MLTRIELPFDSLFPIVSSQLIVVFTFSTADNFQLNDLISSYVAENIPVRSQRFIALFGICNSGNHPHFI